MTNRLILLAVVLVGLIILLVQNISPTLPLVFLGMQTQPLPLALWILSSITAGGLTSVLISTLFKFIIKNSPQLSTSSFQSPRTPTRPQRTNRNEETIPSSGNFSTKSRDEVSQNSDDAYDDYDSDFDDWETDDDEADNWDFEQPKPRREGYSEAQTDQTRENISRRNTSYSYSSQSPQNTGVGKVESVYDADYRVIIPPYQSSATNQSENDDNEDDDWSFFEDDDFEEDEEDKDQPRR
jgi:hypothetical protein